MTRIDRIDGLTGSIAVKAPVKVATTANITLSGAQTIDGVVLTADAVPVQRVLVKDQASGIDNGIYDVKSGAWTRSHDFNGSRDAVDGTQVLINEGAAPLIKQYYLSATNPVEIGTDSLSFVAYATGDTGIYSLADGTRDFTGVVSGVSPTTDSHLATKGYIDSVSVGLDPQEAVLGILAFASATATTGFRYIASETGSGWTIHNIYEYNGATWDETAAADGMITYNSDDSITYVYTTEWVTFSNAGVHNNLSGLNAGDYVHLTVAEYVDHGENTTHTAIVAGENPHNTLPNVIDVEQLPLSYLETVTTDSDTKVSTSGALVNYAKSERLRFEVNVLDYGASTAIADNSTAFQNALDAIKANGGGKLKIPAGNFAFTAGFTYDLGTTSEQVEERLIIEGAGKATALTLDAYSTAIALFQFIGSTGSGFGHLAVRDISIMGVAAENATAIHMSGGVAYNIFSNVFIYAFKYGYDITAVDQTDFSQCQVRWCIYGMIFRGPTVGTTGHNNINFYGCSIQNNTGYGLYVSEYAAFNFWGGTISTNGTASTSSFGIKFVLEGVSNSTCNIIGALLEGNRGASDIELVTSTYDGAILNITGCGFLRTVNYATHSIYADGIVDQRINVSGCVFKYLTPNYTPSASRPLINVSASTTFNDSGTNYYQSSIEAPPAVPPASNPFDQSLNTTDSPSFVDVTAAPYTLKAVGAANVLNTDHRGLVSGENPHNTKLAALSVAIVGDSLSQDQTWGNNWPEQLQRFTGQKGFPIEMKNWAVGGSTFYDALNTADLEGNTKTQVEQTIAQGADIVFVALGVNDALYKPSRTSAQIYADAVAVYDALKAGLPDAKIVLIREVPHDSATAGVSPTALTNSQVVPNSQQLITYNGKTNCRINNSTFLNTAVASANLLEHQVWGNVMTDLVSFSIFDDEIDVSLWKLSRMGLMVDAAHYHEFAHYLWMSTVLDWFAVNNDVDNDIMNIAYNTIDSYYTLVSAGSVSSIAFAEANGINILNTKENWFYSQRSLETYIGPNILTHGGLPAQATFSKAHPDKSCFFSWDGSTLTSSGMTDDHGKFSHPFIADASGYDTSIGVHTAAFAIEVAASSPVPLSYDVYETTIEFTSTVPVSSNPFDQSLDTTDNVTFNQVNTTGGVVADGGYAGSAGTGGLGAEIITRESGTWSVGWAGSQMSFYISASAVINLNQNLLTSSSPSFSNVSSSSYNLNTVGSAVGLNTTHRTSSGTNHSDVVLNNTHRTSSGTNHSDVVLNNTHRTTHGTGSNVTFNQVTTAGSTVSAQFAGPGPSGGRLLSKSLSSYIDFDYTGGVFKLYSGTNTVTVKTFVIDHPDDPDKYLVHGTLEGPEGAVYYRGTAELSEGTAIVELPKYFEALTHGEDRTILLTNVNGFDILCIKEFEGSQITDGRFIVESNHRDSRQKFNWEVKAVRADVPILEVELYKKGTNLHGDGPYTYVTKAKKTQAMGDRMYSPGGEAE